MARRSVLPPHVQAELPQRARYGIGHDMNAATLYYGQTITAYEARLREPSPEMMAVIKSIWKWIEDNGGDTVGLLVDIRHAKHEGCVTIRWSAGPTAKAVAEKFAVNYSENGLPQIPGWISLKNDDDWDLRWQPTYGHFEDPRETFETAVEKDCDTTPQPSPAATGTPVQYELF